MNIDPCTHYERYESMSGIDAHEVLIKDKECEVSIRKMRRFENINGEKP